MLFEQTENVRILMEMILYLEGLFIGSINPKLGEEPLTYL
jgi:hypothetical protein